MLTEADREEIKRIEESAKSSQQSARRMADNYELNKSIQQLQGVPVDKDLDLAMDIVTGVISFAAAAEGQTAEGVVRENKFVACLEERGWSRN